MIGVWFNSNVVYDLVVIWCICHMSWVLFAFGHVFIPEMKRGCFDSIWMKIDKSCPRNLLEAAVPWHRMTKGPSFDEVRVVAAKAGDNDVWLWSSNVSCLRNQIDGCICQTVVPLCVCRLICSSFSFLFASSLFLMCFLVVVFRSILSAFWWAPNANRISATTLYCQASVMVRRGKSRKMRDRAEVRRERSKGREEEGEKRREKQKRKREERREGRGERERAKQVGTVQKHRRDVIWEEAVMAV